MKFLNNGVLSTNNGVMSKNNGGKSVDSRLDIPQNFIIFKQGKIKFFQLKRKIHSPFFDVWCKIKLRIRIFHKIWNSWSKGSFLNFVIKIEKICYIY